MFLASQDALEVMLFTYSLMVSIDLTDVTLVSNDTKEDLIYVTLVSEDAFSRLD